MTFSKPYRKAYMDRLAHYSDTEYQSYYKKIITSGFIFNKFHDDRFKYILDTALKSKLLQALYG